MDKTGSIVSTDWLMQHLDDPHVIPVDTSWFLPGPHGDPRATFENIHIPGARFFDIEDICDKESPLPHMLPTEKVFSEKVGALGISNDDLVVAYDTGGVFPASRAWWMFRAFGHDKVAVLDGGLLKWAGEGKPVTDQPTEITPQTFKAKLKPEMVADRKKVLAAAKNKKAAILDARGPGRFTGEEPEPREGMRSGHMPGAKNLYYGDLFTHLGTFKSDADLKKLLENKGLDKKKEVITTCGSGVTASILALILDRLGFDKVRVYDGSWAEWGSDKKTPIETGKEQKSG